jgi:hypothetical protein
MSKRYAILEAMWKIGHNALFLNKKIFQKRNERSNRAESNWVIFLHFVDWCKDFRRGVLGYVLDSVFSA